MRVMPGPSPEIPKASKVETPTTSRNHRRQARFVLVNCSEHVEAEIAEAMDGHPASLRALKDNDELRKEASDGEADVFVLYARSSDELPVDLVATAHGFPVIVLHPEDKEIDTTLLHEAMHPFFLNSILVVDEESVAAAGPGFAYDALTAVDRYRLPPLDRQFAPSEKPLAS